MQILITGGAGFIGSHTVEAALDAGHAVRVLDDLSSGDRAYLPAGVAFIEGDVTDAATVRDAVAGCDAVIHLAALVSVPQSLREPVRTHHVNTTGTVTLLDAAQHAGVARFVLASTCAVYGDLPGHKEESSRVQPLVPYAASKLMDEQWVQLYGRAYGMETIVLRYFNVYGRASGRIRPTAACWRAGAPRPARASPARFSATAARRATLSPCMTWRRPICWLRRIVSWEQF
ncbi:MAG: NAD-dependent epimerase/dehydratase family protein [Anaerolineales bacterium]|nr:NAD-dependent epimerase/dehydratase family protein [Anaerolineales bacterium]